MVSDHRFEIDVDWDLLPGGLEHPYRSYSRVLPRVDNSTGGVPELVQYLLVVHVTDDFLVEDQCFRADDWVAEAPLVMGFRSPVGYDQIIVNR